MLISNVIKLYLVISVTGGGGALAIAAAIGIATDNHVPRHESNSSVDAFDMSECLDF